MRHHGVFRLAHWISFPLVLILTMFSLAPALAQARDTSGYTFTLTFGNSGPYTSGGVMPTFRGTITVPQGGDTPNSNNVVLQLNGQANAISVSGSGSNTYSTYGGIGNQQPGNYTAVEVFTPPTGSAITSNTLTFTVVAPPAPVTCSIQNTSYVYSQGESLQVNVAADVSSPSVYQGGTFTVTFTGPKTMTDSNLTVGSNGIVTVPTPPETGNYQMQCAYSGNANYAPATSDKTGVTVSLEHQVGSVQVYTNPTTLQPQQSADMYVVFHSAGGLPPPSGRFYIEFIRGSSNPIYLGPDGTILVHLSALPLISGENSFTLFYVGDTNYNSASLTFPITNPPIPGGGSGGNGSGGGLSPSATGTAGPTGTATSAALADAGTPTASSGAVASTSLSRGTPSGGGLPLWAVVLLILVVLGGAGGGGVVFWRRRAKAPVPAMSQAIRNDFTYPQWPPYDE